MDLPILVVDQRKRINRDSRLRPEKDHCQITIDLSPIPEQLKKANWEHLMVSVQVIGMSSNIRNSLVEPRERHESKARLRRSSSVSERVVARPRGRGEWGQKTMLEIDNNRSAFVSMASPFSHP